MGSDCATVMVMLLSSLMSVLTMSSSLVLMLLIVMLCRFSLEMISFVKVCWTGSSMSRSTRDIVRYL